MGANTILKLPVDWMRMDCVVSIDNVCSCLSWPSFLMQNGDDATCTLMEGKGACMTTKDAEGLSMLREAVEVAASILCHGLDPTCDCSYM